MAVGACDVWIPNAGGGWGPGLQSLREEGLGTSRAGKVKVEVGGS